MFREYPNNVSLNGRGFIEQIGGYLLDGVAMSHKLRFTPSFSFSASDFLGIGEDLPTA
jgi:hypothetical protein